MCTHGGELEGEQKEFDTWDKKFKDLAELISTWSKDRSHKVAAVVVNNRNSELSHGYNGFARGVNDNVEKRHQRPDKYFWTEHAERNAFYHAAYEGIALRGGTIYVTLFPCADCARGIIQCGIERVVAPRPNFDHHQYGESFKASVEMLEEVGMKIDYLEYETK